MSPRGKQFTAELQYGVGEGGGGGVCSVSDEGKQTFCILMAHEVDICDAFLFSFMKPVHIIVPAQWLYEFTFWEKLVGEGGAVAVTRVNKRSVF